MLARTVLNRLGSPQTADNQSFSTRRPRHYGAFLFGYGKMNLEAWEKQSLIAIALLILVAFGMGLPGDFVFDDGINLYLNSNFVFSEFDLRNIIRASFSSDSGPLGRPVAMFSFALNQYFAKGFDPLSFKLTNIAVHCLNVFLVFFFLRLLRSFQSVSVLLNGLQQKTLPILVAALWGLHPLVLTSVLYVIQRMTSLSATFMLLGLIAYLLLRLSEFDPFCSKKCYFSWLTVMIVSVVAAVLTKETALLFGFFVAVIEVFFLRFESRSGRSLLAILLILFFAVLPVIVLGLRTLIDPNWILGGYEIRPFSLSERVLTQSRLLFFYLSQIIVPDVSRMGLFLDGFVLSRSYFVPITTLWAVIGWCLLIVFCLYSTRANNGLVRVSGFSIAWFLAGHLLESTIFPLEIAHEHRNYFPMIGVIFLIAVLIGHVMKDQKRSLFIFSSISILLLFFSLTALRASSWRNLTDHSLTEVLHHPSSPRAQYQMGRVYLKWYDETQEVRFLSEARSAFQNSIRVDWEERSGAHFGLLFVAYKAGVKPDPEVIDNLKVRLKNSRTIMVDVGMLTSFAQCQISMECKMLDEEFLQIAAAYLENPRLSSSGRSDVFSAVGAYYVNKMNDRAHAERFFKAALDAFPSVMRYLDLAEYYRITAQFAMSREKINEAKKISRPGSMFNIESLERRLLSSEREHLTKIEN